MHEWVLLGIVAAAFYLIECCAWIAVPCWACYRHPVRGWRAAFASNLAGNDRGGVLLASPLHFSGAVVQSCEWPVAIDPEGLVIGALSDRDAQDPQYLLFNDVQSVRPSLATVLINERVTIATPSAVAAAELAGLLEALRSARKREREKLIKAAMAERFAVADIAARWQWFQRETRVVRVASVISTAWLFAVVPIALLLAGPIASWPYLLAGLLICGVVTATLCFRVHRRLYVVAAADRWVLALSMAFFPLAAFRACDRLSKELMWRFEPVAMVAAFCKPAAYTSVIRPMVFDLSRPPAAGDSAPATCLAWHHEVLTAQLSELLRGAACHPLTAPAREDASMAAFCPRCHAQYLDGREACSTCAAVMLEPFDVAAERSA